MTRLLLFVLPLGLDTFAVAAALGLRGLPPRERLKASMLMSSFELAMPLVGVLLGRGLGGAVGGVADYVAAAVLLGLGAWFVLADEAGEGERAGSLATRDGLALIGLGLSISADELAIGFTMGLLGIPILPAVVLIGVQAFFFAQLGLRLGSRLGEAARESAERLAGVALAGLGVLILVERLA